MLRAIGLALVGLCVSCGEPPSPTPVSSAAPAPPGADAAPEAAPSVDAEAVAAALAHSIALEQQGQLDQAAQAAELALQAGGGQPAVLQAAKIEILRERYDEAEALLRPLLQANPNDADAHYDLGLVAHRRDRYNDARSSYLAALRAREDFADARYNLAVLTWNRNVHEEARHHVTRFVERWPDDPRAKELQALVGATATDAPATSP